MSKQEIHNETIAVIGLGFVGLPLAMLLISKGMRVIGVDLDKKKVEALRKGTSYISDINDQAVQDGIGTGFFRPVSDYSLIGEADAVIICVPTPLNDDAGPDLNYVKRAAAIDWSALEKGRTRRVGKLDISGYDKRHRQTDPGKKRPCMREGFLLGLFSRTR